MSNEQTLKNRITSLTNDLLSGKKVDEVKYREVLELYATNYDINLYPDVQELIQLMEKQREEKK